MVASFFVDEYFIAKRGQIPKKRTNCLNNCLPDSFTYEKIRMILKKKTKSFAFNRLHFVVFLFYYNK